MAKKSVKKASGSKAKKPAVPRKAKAVSIASLSEVDLAAECRRMSEIIRILWREYPEAKCSLDYKTPFQLLVATILSAQCTDERVNKVTPELFARYGTPAKMAKAPLKEIENLVKTTGFFRNKALSLKNMSTSLMELHGGEVPNTLEKLVELRGVGRKTANVVLGNAFDVQGVVVDTHIGRLSRRMGFTSHTDPVKVEKDIELVTPREDWTDMGHLFIAHGRALCTARKAMCEECPIARYCPKIGVR